MSDTPVMDSDSTTTEALLAKLGKHLEQLSTASNTTPISSIQQVDLTSVDAVAMRAGPCSLVWVSTAVPAWAATVVGEYLPRVRLSAMPAHTLLSVRRP